jgi:hypothetical protein
MTDILISSIAAPKAHIVFGITSEENKEEKNRNIQEEEKDGNE